jgi:hypothetical protein
VLKASAPQVGVEVLLEALLFLRKSSWVPMRCPLRASDGALIFCFFVHQNGEHHPHLWPFDKRRMIIRWFFRHLFRRRCVLPSLGVQKIYAPMPHKAVCGNTPHRCEEYYRLLQHGTLAHKFDRTVKIVKPLPHLQLSNFLMCY